jgi:hypothetical protein
MERSASPPATAARDTTLALTVIAAITVFQLVLAFAVLEPRAFFAHDSGVKYLQAHSLVTSHWRSMAVAAPGDRIDTARRFSFLGGNQFNRRTPEAPFYGLYSALFTVPVSLMLALFGVRGLYIVPILATTATMILAYRLAARTAGRAAWLAPLLVGACSPMLFYGVDLWEHTLAALLIAVAVLAVAVGTPTGDRRCFALAGFSLGATITLREETMAMLPAGLVAIAWVPHGRRLGALAAAGFGVLMGATPLMLLKWSQIGMPVRNPVLRLMGILPGLPRPSEPPGLNVLEMLIPSSTIAVTTLAALVAVRGILPRIPPTWRPVLFGVLAAGSVVWALADALTLVLYWWHPNPLIAAFPAALALLLIAPRQGQGDPARREIGQLLAIAALFATAVCAADQITRTSAGGAGWGPRYLMPVYPMLATAVAFAVARRREWAAMVGRSDAIVLLTVAALAGCSLLVQLQGLRDLRNAKEQYERLVRATEAVAPQELIVTSVPWLGTITAAVATERPILLVNHPNTGTLDELLAALDEWQVDRLTFVSITEQERPLADRFTRADWQAERRTVVPVWLDLNFTEYRRNR